MEPNLQDGIFSAAFVIAVTYAMTLYAGKLVSTRPVRTTVLFLWHTLFSVLYAAYSLSTVADAKMYFREGGLCIAGFSPGTDFVIAASCFLQSALGANYLPVALVSGAVGGFGLVIFDAALRMAAQNSKQGTRLLASFLPFLPSISFWSAGLGKDSFAFLAAALFCLAMFNIKHRVLVAVSAILIMGAVRPHIAALQFAALFVTFVFKARISFLKRSAFVVVAVAVALSAAPYVMNYVGLNGSLNLATLQEYVAERQGYNLEGGSSVQLAAQNPIERVFTLLFRPTLLEARSAQYFMAGLENAILLLLFVSATIGIFRRRRPVVIEYWITGVSYSLLGIVVLSQTIANLGLASRQKWMVIPPLLVVVVAIRAARSSVPIRDAFQIRPVGRLTT
jgi:hypothetical protein